MKTQLARSARLASAGTAPGRFSTGNASPVSAAWLTKRSRASSSTASAGIRLPAASATTSPVTIRSGARLAGLPSRSTVARTRTRARSRSPIALGVPAKCSIPRTSRNASSIEIPSTTGDMSSKTAKTSLLACE